jgi:hypothetical protein
MSLRSKPLKTPCLFIARLILLSTYRGLTGIIKLDLPVPADGNDNLIISIHRVQSLAKTCIDQASSIADLDRQLTGGQILEDHL